MNANELKFPRSGPFVVRLKNGTLDVWYDRFSRSWVVQTKDLNNNQIGPNGDGSAEYVYTRGEAVRSAQAIIKEDAQ